MWYNYDPKMKERMNKQGLGHRSVAVVFVDGRSEVGVHATHQPSHRKSTSYINGFVQDAKQMYMYIYIYDIYSIYVGNHCPSFKNPCMWQTDIRIPDIWYVSIKPEVAVDMLHVSQVRRPNLLVPKSMGNLIIKVGGVTYECLSTTRNHQVSSDQTLVICCKLGIILTSYMGIIINHYNGSLAKIILARQLIRLYNRLFNSSFKKDCQPNLLQQKDISQYNMSFSIEFPPRYGLQTSY